MPSHPTIHPSEPVRFRRRWTLAMGPAAPIRARRAASFPHLRRPKVPLAATSPLLPPPSSICILPLLSFQLLAPSESVSKVGHRLADRTEDGEGEEKKKDRTGLRLARKRIPTGKGNCHLAEPMCSVKWPDPAKAWMLPRYQCPPPPPPPPPPLHRSLSLGRPAESCRPSLAAWGWRWRKWTRPSAVEVRDETAYARPN